MQLFFLSGGGSACARKPCAVFCFLPFPKKNRKRIGNCPQKLACFCRYPSRQFSNGKGYISCIFPQKAPVENILEFVYPPLVNCLKSSSRTARRTCRSKPQSARLYPTSFGKPGCQRNRLPARNKEYNWCCGIFPAKHCFFYLHT